MPTTATSSAASTGREAYDNILVPENKRWLGDENLVHHDKSPAKFSPLVHERQVIASTSSSFSRVSSTYCQIRVPRNSGDLLGNMYLNYDRAALTFATVTSGSVYALDFEIYQSIAKIRMSYRGVEFWSVTGPQMYSMLMELPEKERAAIAVTAAGHRSVAERKILAKSAIHLACPILTPWHNKLDKMFPLKNLVDDILVEIAFVEDQYVFHTPGTTTAATTSTISAVNLNIDVYHEDPVKSVDTMRKFSKGGNGNLKWIFDEWQMHVAEPWVISAGQTSASTNLKLDNFTGQIYKLGVQVRVQANVTSSQYLAPNYTEPINLLKLLSNNRDIVVQEYRYREAYGKTPDTMEHYYEHLANPGSELNESSVDRQFVYMPLGAHVFNALNKPNVGGVAGTRQLSAYTAPTLNVTINRASSGLDYNPFAPSFVHEGGTNSAASGVSFLSKYLTVVAWAKNEIVFVPGVGPQRLFAMR